jgi:hypothetical protein
MSLHNWSERDVNRAAAMSSNPDDFKGLVSRMISIEGEVKEKSANIRELNQEKRSLKEQVIDYMEQNGVGRVNISETERIALQHKVGAGSLTRKRLAEALKYLNGVEGVEVEQEELHELDENVVKGMCKAQEQLEIILEFLDRDPPEKTDLIRENRNKKKRARAPAAPPSVFVKPSKKAAAADEVEEAGGGGGEVLDM